METKIDAPKVPNMVMCGDHPSFTKTELNAKDSAEEKEVLTALSGTKVSSTSCRTEPVPPPRPTVPERALRARRRERGDNVAVPDRGARPDAISRAHNGTLMQAALGSARWPPYVVCVWVCALLATHALHGLVGGLERALPTLRTVCQYLRSNAERSWYTTESVPLWPAILAALAAICYTAYFTLYVVYSVALWSIEPLTFDEPKSFDMDTKVTDYEDCKSEDSLK